LDGKDRLRHLKLSAVRETASEAADAGQDRVLAREALRSYGLEPTGMRLASRALNAIFRVDDRLRDDGYRAPRLGRLRMAVPRSMCRAESA
jgi:hypothetical protein